MAERRTHTRAQAHTHRTKHSRTAINTYTLHGLGKVSELSHNASLTEGTKVNGDVTVMHRKTQPKPGSYEQS